MINLFRTDISIFNLIYQQCKTLGDAFFMGAFEGFVIYSGLIILAIVKVGEKKNDN